jgi:hypothetical protein
MAAPLALHHPVEENHKQNPLAMAGWCWYKASSKGKKSKQTHDVAAMQPSTQS